MNQKKNLKYEFLIFILGGGILLLFLLCSQKQPVEPEKPCINDQPVEDTTRVYLHPTTLDTIYLEPYLLYVKFNPSVTDTNLLNALLEKYDLHNRYNEIGRVGEQYEAYLETKNKRAEYFFTPYGKKNFCNFGADSLVEYSFGLFWSKTSGSLRPNGGITFKFNEGTSDAKIDSFFTANGLRFWYKRPDIPAGIKYTTCILPEAPKNVIDLGLELKNVQFVDRCIVGIAYGLLP
jgi:hypothetical protein